MERANPGPLLATIPDNPLRLLEAWLEAARGTGLSEFNAMTLATTDHEGRPTARVVLCKEVRRDALVFFTNYQSPKGRELAERPYAAATFYWPALAKQVRVSGPITKCGRAESEAYFATRPRGSQIGAWASHQSEVLASYAALEAAFKTVSVEYAGRDVPCPPHWGGYVLTAEACELWIGKESRLHDRVLCRLVAGVWEREQLAP